MKYYNTSSLISSMVELNTSNIMILVRFWDGTTVIFYYNIPVIIILNIKINIYILACKAIHNYNLYVNKYAFVNINLLFLCMITINSIIINLLLKAYYSPVIN